MSFSVSAEDRTRIVYATASKGWVDYEGSISWWDNIRVAWIPIQASVLHLSIT